MTSIKVERRSRSQRTIINYQLISDHFFIEKIWKGDLRFVSWLDKRKPN